MRVGVGLVTACVLTAVLVVLTGTPASGLTAAVALVLGLAGILVIALGSHAMNA